MSTFGDRKVWVTVVTKYLCGKLVYKRVLVTVVAQHLIIKGIGCRGCKSGQLNM